MKEMKILITAVTVAWLVLVGVIGYIIWDKRHNHATVAQGQSMNNAAVLQMISDKVNPILAQFHSQFNQISEHDADIVTSLKALEQAINTGNNTWSMTQIQYYIEQAVVQASIMRNPQMAIQFLDIANMKLQHINNPNYLALREAIAKDRQMLAAALTTNRENVIIALNTMVDALPQIKQRTSILSPTTPVSTEPSPQAKTWKENIRSALANFKSLIVVRHHVEGEHPYFSPNEATMVNESTEIMLLQAAFAVSTGNQELFENNVHMAIAWFNRYYDIDSPMGQQVMNTLNKIKDLVIAMHPVDKFESINTWNTIFKVPTEEGVKG